MSKNIGAKVPPLIPEYYAACHFSEFMPDVVDIGVWFACALTLPKEGGM